MSEAIVVVVVQVEVNRREQNLFHPLQAFLANQHQQEQLSLFGVGKDDGLQPTLCPFDIIQEQRH